jgi:pentapeptide repeat protein
MRLWKRLQAALPRLGVAVLVIAFIAFIVFIVFIGVAYYTGVFPDPDWTGFGTPKVNADGQEIAHFKTLWDWLGLLLIPLVLAIGGYFLTRSENRYALSLQEQREQEASLRAYLDQMTELLLHEKLRTSRPDAEVRSVARIRTLTVLRVLDGVRKATVMQFLYEAELIGGIHYNEEGDVLGTIDAIVSLDGAHLDGAYLTEAYLTKADLSGAHLRGALLTKADLSGASLRGALLTEADLTEADLSRANLRSASLDGANLTDCKVTREQLAKARSLEGAKLPSDTAPPPAPEVEVAAQEDQAKEHTVAAAPVRKQK